MTLPISTLYHPDGYVMGFCKPMYNEGGYLRLAVMEDPVTLRPVSQGIDYATTAPIRYHRAFRTTSVWWRGVDPARFGDRIHLMRRQGDLIEAGAAEVATFRDAKLFPGFEVSDFLDEDIYRLIETGRAASTRPDEPTENSDSRIVRMLSSQPRAVDLSGN